MKELDAIKEKRNGGNNRIKEPANSMLRRRRTMESRKKMHGIIIAGPAKVE